MERSDEFDGFEWEDSKSDWTFRERGFDFAFAAQLFDDVFLQREDTRKDYRETRYIVSGHVQEFYITVVWTPRGRNRHIIAAWKTKKRERRTYDDYRESLERRDP